MNTPRRPSGPLRLVILLVGLHSVVLGVAFLLAPVRLARLAGFPELRAAFFVSQSGIFLLVLGICYLLALRDRSLVVVILVSKTLAVLFLLTHVVFLNGPPVLWLLAAGDALMLSATVGVLRFDSGSA